MCTQHASNYKLKIYFKKIKWKFFPKSTLSASIHSTVYGRPTSCRKYTSKKTKYGEPWDVQWRDDGWKCATRDAFNRRKFCLSIGWTIKVRFGIWMIGSNPYIQRTYKRRHPKAIVKSSSKGSLFYVIDGTELNRISRRL